MALLTPVNLAQARAIARGYGLEVAELEAVNLAQARAIARGYGLEVAELEALRAGSVNSNFRLVTPAGERFFMRVYEEQGLAGARAELAMIRELSALGIPTPAPLAQRGGEHAGEHAGKPVGIHRWVDGEIACLDRVTRTRAARLGAALAKVHGATPQLSVLPRGRFRTEDLYARLDAIEAAGRGFEADTQLIRQRLAHHGALLPSGLPSGLIHGDLFRDNVLWSGDELVALLDFESASAGVFAYDLMVCVHAWCFREAFDLELVRALVEGYLAVRLLSHDERRALRPLGALAALRFATTRITDFSLRAAPGQRPARDYRRFLDRLEALEQGALDPIITEGLS